MNDPVRLLAWRIVYAASALLPRHMESWGRAMRCELAAIAGDRAAILFALGCLRAAFALAVAERIDGAAQALSSTSPATRSSPDMNSISTRPRLLGLICGAAAVGAGLAYMLAAGAPSHYLVVNFGALVIGAAVWLAFGKAAGSRLPAAGPAVLLLAISILFTALLGVPADGASRWISVGPLSLQVSLIVVPAMAVLYARRPDALWTSGMIVAAAALALQPDRAMAGVLLAGLLGLDFVAPKRNGIVAAAAAAVAFAWTLLTPDRLPASPFVDRILYTAFDVHPLAGAAVVVGAAALVVPAAIAALRGAGERPAILAFGGCWSGVVIAAALGNYPTPLVGYGGSAVLGYLLSVALLPNDTRDAGLKKASETPLADERGLAQTHADLRLPGLA